MEILCKRIFIKIENYMVYKYNIIVMENNIQLKNTKMELNMVIIKNTIKINRFIFYVNMNMDY